MYLLRLAADSTEARFISPVYLVGSYIKRPYQAGDIDIVMVVTEERMKRLCGELGYNERRYRLNRKQKLWWEQYVKNMDIDFKVQTVEEFEKHKDKPRVKLGRYCFKPE